MLIRLQSTTSPKPTILGSPPSWIPTSLDDHCTGRSEWDINLASLGQSLTVSRMGWEHILGPTLDEDSDVDWDRTHILGPSTPREDELEHGVCGMSWGQSPYYKVSSARWLHKTSNLDSCAAL
ncbi:hypothetical protein FRC12_007034 [Ceratobasidium sp. 428]|nr:hypothetical protein FRC12_007034 [Ceratobasidium sp. 428]